MGEEMTTRREAEINKQYLSLETIATMEIMTDQTRTKAATVSLCLSILNTTKAYRLFIL